MVALGTVPMQDGNEAAKELERCMKTLGFKGVEILTNVAGKELSDPAFAPFWKKAEELDALVIIHPNGFTEGQRLSRFYFNNVIGNPFDTTMALHYLIFDGVLERHPKLEDFRRARRRLSRRLFRPHRPRLGRALGLPGRFAEAADALISSKSISIPWCLRRMQLEALVKTFGADHVIMGTDYPFDMLEYDPIGHINSVDSFDDKTAALAGGSAKIWEVAWNVTRRKENPARRFPQSPRLRLRGAGARTALPASALPADRRRGGGRAR